METLQINNIWITIVTILFALSLISERISNLIKLYIPALKSKSENEKNRERNIMILAICSGWLVAFISGADFFKLIESGELVPLKDLNNTNILGVVLTGLFISMGSKFWHDILDIVLQFSKLKKFKAINEENASIETFSYDDLKEKEQRLEQLVRKNLDKLRSIKNYGGYNIERKTNRFIAQIKFIESLPKEDEISWIEDYLLPIEYEIKLTSKTVISGN